MGVLLDLTQPEISDETRDERDLRLWLEENFTRIDSSIRAIASHVEKNTVFVAYNGVQLTSTHTDTDIGASWIPLDFYNAYLTATGRGIAIALNGRFTFAAPSTYFIALNSVFEHNELNAGRNTNLRLWNETDSVPGPTIRVPTGRNQTTTTAAAFALTDIVEAQVDKVFRVEIGGGDTYTSVVWSTAAFSIFNVGPTPDNILVQALSQILLTGNEQILVTAGLEPLGT